MQSERSLECKKCNGFSEIINNKKYVEIRQDVLSILKGFFLAETHWITVN